MDPSIYDLDACSWALAALCGLVVGMSKCGLAGLSSIAIPLMPMLMPAKASTGVMLPVFILGDAMGVAHFNRHANWKLLWRLIPAALLGILIGFWLLKQPWLDDRAIRKSIGVIVLVICIMNIFKERLKMSFGEGKGTLSFAIACFFGVMAGVTTMVANASGPIMVIYLLAMGLKKDEFIGTSAWYFMLLNWIKVPLMIRLGMMNPDSLLFDFKLAPVILVGGILGIFLTDRLSEKNYKFVIQVLTVITAIKLLF